MEDNLGLAGDIIYRSFFNDPGAVLFFPDEEERARQMPSFFSIMARFSHAVGEGLLTDDGSGVALYLPPEPEVPPDLMSRLGMRTLVARWPFPVQERVELFLSTLNEVQDRSLRQPYWELHFLGVLPEARGRGHGVALVDAISGRADRDGLPSYLATLTEKNVAFYENRGYAVVTSETVPGTDVRVWGMTR